MHKKRCDKPRKHLLLNGAVSSGKGFGGTPIKNQEGVYSIVTGDMIRVRLASDPMFEKTWGNNISQGHLLPDPVLSPMVNVRYIKGVVLGMEEVLWDGWHRTPDQVDEFCKKYVCEGDSVMAVFIKASKSTCEQRNNHRNLVSNRTDGGSFETRWRIYCENEHLVRSAFSDHGIDMIEIDGNQDLDTVAQEIWSVWCDLTGKSTPMPEIKRHEVPKHSDHRMQAETIPLGTLTLAAA